MGGATEIAEGLKGMSNVGRVYMYVLSDIGPGFNCLRLKELQKMLALSIQIAYCILSVCLSVLVR